MAMRFARVLTWTLPLLLAAAPATRPAATRFPHDWVGDWRGPCTSAGADGKSIAFVMELNVAPTHDPARWRWEIVYEREGTRQVRPYELIVIDDRAGRYVIDEKNSIRIESTFLDGALYSQFDVAVARVTASYRLDGERIVVELVTTDAKQPQPTGGAGQVPPVTAYPARAVQRAVLSKR